jgi:predicted Rossmann fold nucleotide-binding protein DprA/Smf involved in DNA uptake
MTRLLSELERGPATIDDLVDSTGMTADSIRAQLSQLVALGAVKSDYRVPVSLTVTRMRKVYEVAA